MYTVLNFKTKKALKAAVTAGQPIKVFSPGPFPCPAEGAVTLEGPHYPEPHRWYAEAILENGLIVKVR